MKMKVICTCLNWIQYQSMTQEIQNSQVSFERRWYCFWDTYSPPIKMFLFCGLEFTQTIKYNSISPHTHIAVIKISHYQILRTKSKLWLALRYSVMKQTPSSKQNKTNKKKTCKKKNNVCLQMDDLCRNVCHKGEGVRCSLVVLQVNEALW